MQSVSSKIWTRIAVFISYGDNDYTTGTSTMVLCDGTYLPASLRKQDVTQGHS